ncbi:MAG: phosphomannomutase/phosphoglucomutase [Parcubacteria group bacterium]|nr:phosphomannomutase/phosphoglucomutase [Parcubacteria group bacterium]
MEERKILKDCEYKSYDWANKPVIAESLFREYDLRNPIQTMTDGDKTTPASVNIDGYRVLGQAYGTYVQQKLKQNKIVVANDYRSYSRGLAYAFITGMLASGVDVIDIGTQLTPVLYFAQYHFDLLGGVIITASHNDNGWAGLKIAKGLSQTFEPDDIIEYKKMVYAGKFLSGQGNYARVYDFKDVYLKDIEEKVKPWLGKKKLKIVVSGGNGGGGLYLEELLTKLDFEVVPIYNKLDWDFPNFNPNPEHLKFLELLGEEVRKVGADFGIGTDGDGDRLGLVDENGKEIFADRAGLFIARYLVENTPEPKQKIIVDVKSTGASTLDPVLQKHKTEVIFWKTGHSYIKAATQKHNALAGFERSGHFFLRGKYGRGYDDGTLSAAWIAIILSNSDKPLSVMVADQPNSYQSPTLSPAVKDDKEKYEIVDKVTAYFKNLQEKGEKFAGLAIEDLITVNGVRFVFEDGAWGLIRASSNLPTLVITCESFNTKREMYNIMEAIQDHLKQYDIGKYDQEMPPYEKEK